MIQALGDQASQVVEQAITVRRLLLQACTHLECRLKIDLSNGFTYWIALICLAKSNVHARFTRLVRLLIHLYLPTICHGAPPILVIYPHQPAYPRYRYHRAETSYSPVQAA